MLLLTLLLRSLSHIYSFVHSVPVVEPFIWTIVGNSYSKTLVLLGAAFVYFVHITTAFEFSLPPSISIVRISGTRAGTMPKIYWIIRGRVRRELPDVDSTLGNAFARVFKFAGFDDIPLVDASNISSLTAGSPLPRLVPSANNADEFRRVWLLIMQAVQDDNILYNITALCKICCNPSYITWRGYGLLAVEWRLTSIQYNFSWADTVPSFLPSPPQDPFLGLSKKTSLDLSNGTVHCIDARFVVAEKDSRMYMAYFASSLSGKRTGEDRMGLAEIRSDGKSGPLYMAWHREIEYPGKQKNWVPFMYNDTLHFVQMINPMHVVKLKLDGANSAIGSVTPSKPRRRSGPSVDGGRYRASILPNVLQVETVSFVPHVSVVPWHMGGHLRGGTNAQYIPGGGQKQKVSSRGGGFYLAFFHSGWSADHVSNYHTYHIGAYTFSPHPPFRLLKMSVFPLLFNALYEGAWYDKKLDYVNHAFYFYMEDENTIVLSIGHNNLDGYLARIRLDILLQNMDNIIYSSNS